MRPFLAVAFLVLASVQASAQRDINWDTVQIKTQKLDDNVLVRVHSYNNGGVSGRSAPNIAHRSDVTDHSGPFMPRVPGFDH